MSEATAPVRESAPPGRAFPSCLWHRELSQYPTTGRRAGFLAIVVLAAVVLYYEQYVAGSVSTSILGHYGMSFRYYLTIVVVASAIGAVASLAAGLADRWGRANLVVVGLLVAGLVTTFGVPHAGSALAFGACYATIGLVEGVVLVATPALVRDFSPQVGRGTAMGLWSLGPVVGSLVVAEVSSNTLSHLHAWQDQYTIAGITGLVVFVAALLALRELAPPLRDQLMVTRRDRLLVEARARGIDVETATRRPWRQMLHADVLVPATALSVFLLIYYAAVGFFVIYFTTVFGFSEQRADALGNWFWATDAVVVVVAGVVSDRLHVRKPFMVAGGIGAVVMTFVFATRATDPATTYVDFILIVSVLSAFRGATYSPWMAAFTETVERRNPALVATGLAVWGWILRVVVALTFLVVPFVVTSVTPLVAYGPRVKAITTTYAPEVATIAAVPPATLAVLRTDPTDGPAITVALHAIATREHVSVAEAITRLKALKAMPLADRAYLQAHGVAVRSAKQNAPVQWKRWWWVCLAGEVVFLPAVLLMVGRWRPSKARADAEAHRRLVDRELARLAETGSSPVGSPV
ncbi:MAG: MFS transporter [Acidimicrobiales bacterium]